MPTNFFPSPKYHLSFRFQFRALVEMSVLFSKLPTSMSQRAQQTVLNAATTTLVSVGKVPSLLGALASTLYNGAHKSVDSLVATFSSQQTSPSDNFTEANPNEAGHELTWLERLWGENKVVGDNAV